MFPRIHNKGEWPRHEFEWARGFSITGISAPCLGNHACTGNCEGGALLLRIMAALTAAKGASA